MGGFDLSMPAAPFRVRAAAGSGSGPPATALSCAIAEAATAGLSLSIVAEQAETTALVARMTTAPTTTRRGQIDGLIAGLKSDGVWGKLDWLLLLAAHNAQAARLNWRAAKTLSAVNAPTYTTDRGYAGDGASAYLDFGEAFGASGNQFVQNSATVGVWCNQQGTGSGDCQLFNSTTVGPYIVIGVNASGSDQGAINDNASLAPAAAGTRMGHRTVSRTASNAAAFYRAGISVATSAAASTGLGPGNGWLLHNPFGTYSTDRLAAAYSGGGLTGTETAALHGRLNTYLTAIGGA